MAERQQDSRSGSGSQGQGEQIPMRQLPKHWGRDWRRAYSILTRDETTEARPKGWWARTRALYRGVKAKLSPARRTLLFICLILAFLGLDEERDARYLLIAFLGLAFLLLLELADRTRSRDELEVARRLQRDLLPRESPPLPGYEFAFSYRAANTIGGDYYHFLPVEGGKVALLVGDASGHGMAAGLLMAISDTTLHIALETDPSPLAVAAMLNRTLTRTGGTRAFMSLFYGLLDPDSGHLDYVCAGHPFALLRQADGGLKRLGIGSYPLGLRDGLKLEAETAEIAIGDLLVLYTDGIPEAVDKNGESFGYERFEQAVQAGATAQEVHDRVLAELTRFQGEEPLLDDCSLVVMRRMAS
jgi:serine phosphatase RsbU (regulator of sigma subunit)